MSEYKKLTQEQIDLLVSRGCRAEDWGTVYCTDPQSLNYVRGVRFSGTVKFGTFTEVFRRHQEAFRPQGVHPPQCYRGGRLPH